MKWVGFEPKQYTQEALPSDLASPSREGSLKLRVSMVRGLPVARVCLDWFPNPLVPGCWQIAALWRPLRERMFLGTVRSIHNVVHHLPVVPFLYKGTPPTCCVVPIQRYNSYFLRTASFDVPSEGKSAFAQEIEYHIRE